MNQKTQLLDCTLRDGAYIVDAKFGKTAMKGIIKKLCDANVDIIECGWLKDAPHEEGTSFFHIPSDLAPYLLKKNEKTTYVAMIDWDRYDLSNLPERDGKTIDAVRVVFPYGKHPEGIEVGKKIAEKGYKVYFQAANTLAYGEKDLEKLAEAVNEAAPEGLSVVDTFGAMYREDLERIVRVLDRALDQKIRLGFHSHNNQQLSFALSMHFAELTERSGRAGIADASLCGMGRGAGNATTELMANYLNKKQHGNYDMDQIMDAIDMYMSYFQENYSWGYSAPYFIAGMYCCHVNNIAYLQKNHRVNARDMRNIIESLSPEDRKKYDYGLLEEKYLENQDRAADDEAVIEQLRKEFFQRDILLIAPGRTSDTGQEGIKARIKEKNSVVIGVNAVLPYYHYDYLFIVNSARYEYAKEIYPRQFHDAKKILLSNIKTEAGENEVIVNFNRAVKRGWEHFDNAVICLLRLLDKLHVKEASLAGFDGFKRKYNESYADVSLPTLNPENRWDELNDEIDEMFQDFKRSSGMKITFLTESVFDKESMA